MITNHVCIARCADGYHATAGAADRETMSCGHKMTAGQDWPAHGRDSQAGADVTMCYPCADALELATMSGARVYAGYVVPSDDAFTTWTGGHLADVTSCRRGPWRYTPTGGAYRMRYIRARMSDGSTWHGRGSDDQDLVTLHRDA
jgi:hypothetical protein